MPNALWQTCRQLHNKLSASTQRHRHLAYLLCTILGATSPLYFAPYNYWPLAIVSLAIFACLLSYRHCGKSYFLHAFFFALGYYGAGIYWVIISIHEFGAAPLPLALLLTMLFVTFIAIIFALPFYALHWCKPQLRTALGLPVIWVISEWIRTWLLTGFPWLLTGYSLIDTPLAGWAPIGGILFISLCGLLCASTLALWAQGQRCYRLLAVTLSLWLIGAALSHVSWTTPNEERINIGVVQPNTPQALRWEPSYQRVIKQQLLKLSQPLWGNDWLIWPEAAVPEVYSQAQTFLQQTKTLAEQHNTTVITGIILDTPSKTEGTRYFNSLTHIGALNPSWYHKNRLVPFGEYVPLEHWLRGLIAFFDLPSSAISRGPSEQMPLQLADHRIGSAICYEIVYASRVAKQAYDSQVLLTISNDAWFGASTAPQQHFQMARMRALETGRYLIRGTNNGISAIIEPNGNIQTQAPQFTATGLSGYIHPTQGRTPFVIWRHYFVLSLLLILCLVLFTKAKPAKCMPILK